ncbi:eukaryotic translation initiation factor 2 subunit 2 isoform X2 [Ischnura elegans]|uniref:eukaryotic translation initiation factor 2 subunit 2 isoform X2 n=1 Tax=Ischnura elegans TaxID=197161 RepID=UPI001ED87891|nr:eukaryotic translation initiation factor 2 subunit 2 isoform X2 [Ischnura elegans]
MAEEDAIFDPTMKKKKKKKKTAFDIDAALAEGTTEGSENAEPNSTDKENQEPSAVDGDAKDKELEDGSFDIGIKKRKKKKPFSLEELESALPESVGGKGKEEVSEEQNGGAAEDGVVEDSFDLDMDFSKTKKKKKKKKDFDELVAEEEKKEAEEKENSEETSHTTWSGSDRDYTYDELITRVFNIMREKNPDMVAGKKQKFIIIPPQVVRIGTKKTSFANFTEICKTLHRQPKHLLDFLLAELGTSGSVDGNNQLIIKGRFQQKQIENVLRRYIKEYVTCHTCRSPDTILQKDTRLFFLQCETCGSRCSVASIKSGFQAVTGKRAAIRAKTA